MHKIPEEHILRVYNDYTASRDNPPSMSMLSKMTGSGRDRLLKVLKEHGLEVLEKQPPYPKEEFKAKYAEMFKENGKKPSARIMAELTGMSTSRAFEIIREINREEDERDELKSSPEIKELPNVYATSDTMRMLVERANRRANG